MVADRLQLEASTPLFHLERLRLAGDEPLALDSVWLPAALAAPLLEADFTHTALYHELATRAGVRLAGGHEHVRAVVPSGAQQRLLGLPRSVGALAIDRLGYAGDRPIEWRHTLIRGDRCGIIPRSHSLRDCAAYRRPGPIRPPDDTREAEAGSP